ncbi:MAG: acyl dehydratase [Pelagibacterium sp. SCN 64-44]|nr:MAG: acyl dehydratase [Pelagibacterium sp. SCN 64-44]
MSDLFSPDRPQLCFDDLAVRQELETLVIGPLTPSHAFRWSAAIENFHRIHYDQNFAIYHEGLPNILIQGSWKQSILPRYLKDLTAPGGWAWKIAFQHRAMIVPGDTITVWSRVTGLREVGGLGAVELDLGMRLQSGLESCPGSATVFLPLRGGKEVPYPFVLPEGYHDAEEEA